MAPEHGNSATTRDRIARQFDPGLGIRRQFRQRNRVKHQLPAPTDRIERRLALPANAAAARGVGAEGIRSVLIRQGRQIVDREIDG